MHTVLIASANKQPLPKKIFDYDVIERLGEGARSVIYAVSDPKSKQLFALKHVKRENEKDDRFIEQVLNEYEVGKKAAHENLRKIVDLRTGRNLLLKINEVALLMELFDGQPLEINLPKSLSKMVKIFIETARAIEAMHKAGYVHCDLKPINILVNTQMLVKVIDLGQAAPINTEKKRIQGTADYIAPEQVKLRPVTIRTDIYNLGATMYWALTNKKLPTMYTLRKQAKAAGAGFLLDDHIIAPNKINSHVPTALSELVMQCVKSDPRQRPADMGEVIQRLQALLQSGQRHRQSSHGHT